MPKSRRRRRFFALEGRLEVDDTGELQGVVEPAPEHIAAPVPFTEEAAAADPSPESEPPPAQDDTLPPAFRLNRKSHGTRSVPSRRAVSPGALLLAFVGLLAGLLIGFLWSRTATKPAALEAANDLPKEVEALTAADQDALDAAYAARQARDFPTAGRLFAELDRRHPDWGPVRVETGRTLFYAGETGSAAALLKQALDKGWKPGEANLLLAMIAKGRRNYREAEKHFARAVALDPTVPEYYFFWGECLREQGKLIDAVAKFRSALLRNQYETATGLYRAKLWLCTIEAGQGGDGVNAEIDAALAGAHTPMETFVAAAARDMRVGDVRAAVAHLTTASQHGDPVVFLYLLADPMFAEVRANPEFAGWVRPAPPSPSPAGSPAP